MLASKLVFVIVPSFFQLLFAILFVQLYHRLFSDLFLFEVLVQHLVLLMLLFKVLISLIKDDPLGIMIQEFYDIFLDVQELFYSFDKLKLNIDE